MERAEAKGAEEQKAVGQEEAPEEPTTVEEALEEAASFSLTEKEQEQPVEEIPEQSEVEIGLLAMLVAQQPAENTQPPVQAEQDAMIGRVLQEEGSQTQPNLWQSAVTQEGEPQAVSTTEAAVGLAADPEFANTLTQTAPEPVTKMVEADPRLMSEQNTAQPRMNLAREDNAQAFPLAGQAAGAPVIDLSGAGNIPLEFEQASSILQQSIFDQVQTAVSTGKQELFVQLKPENLGGLVIQLTMTEEGLKAQVRTGSENIQNMINAQVGQLEDALRARDIPIVQMDIIYDQPYNGSQLNQHRQAWQQGGGSGRGPLLVPAVESAGMYEAVLDSVPVTLEADEGVTYSA